MKLTIDFETRSPVNLKEAGAFKYATDPGTDVWCLAVKADDAAPRAWINPQYRKHFPETYPTIDADGVRDLVLSADTIEAHNAAFELVVWREVMHRRYGWPDLPFERVRCSMALCGYHGLPRGLDDAIRALGLPVQKDMEGHGLMVRMAKPKPKGGWYDDAARVVRLVNYCLQDVEAEHALSAALPFDLSPFEWSVWRRTHIINARGFAIDTEAVRAWIASIEEEKTRLKARALELTGGVSATNPVAAAAWVAERTGATLPNFQKSTVADLIASWGDNLPGDVAEFLSIRQRVAKSSTAKYAALARSEQRGVVRGTEEYYAADTGRWGGRRFQPQNLPRPKFKNVDACIDALLNDPVAFSEGWPDAMVAASSCIRGMVVPRPGNRFRCSDYSSIEGRVLAWLAGDEPALNVYREGRCAYRTAAALIYGRKYEEIGEESQERQVGKTSELALGYQGGIAAYASMASNYSIDLETLPPLIRPIATAAEVEWAMKLADEFLRKQTERKNAGLDYTEMSRSAAIACDIIKQKWRANRPLTTAFWSGLENASAHTVRVGKPTRVGFVRYAMSGCGRWLRCILPSGRALHYPFPKIKGIRTPWGAEKHAVTVATVDGTTKQWVRRALYGGLLAENVTQAVARDLLAHSMGVVESAGYPVVLHVHDELLTETPEGFGSLDELNELMALNPEWAAGLPVKAAGWEGYRYRK